MRLTKIYTKVGDKGATSLATGEKLRKSHDRIESYGNVDELNAFCGLISDKLSINTEENFDSIKSTLFLIQNELFDVGGELSTPLDKLNTARQQVVTSESIRRLEEDIDRMNSSLEPLANFVLPGGHELNSLTHIARTICRRAERSVVRLSDHEDVRPEVMIYLNRLSDWFFVASRYISKKLSIEEIQWQQRKHSNV